MGSLKEPSGTKGSPLLENSCGYLLRELQLIWDEVGEDQFERERVLLDLEQECLEAYRRKVDRANMSRARLHQELAESEAELTHLLLSLGERSLPGRPEKKSGTLKEQLDSITPALCAMRIRKEERMKQFRAVQGQIQKISAEIAGKLEYDESSNIIVDENDLALKKLEEYQTELKRLQSEKAERLHRVENHIKGIHSLSATLGMEASMTITKVHPSLNDLYGISKNISDDILMKLNDTVKSLEEEKQKRLEKLHHLGTALTNLWNLMDTPYEEQHPYFHIKDLLSLSPAEVSNPESLTLGIIQQAEVEVRRLDQLKASKMKELLLKKHNEIEDLCNRSHIEIPSKSNMENITNLIEAGEIDNADLLRTMDEQISRVKEEALSRKAIMEKVERWMLALDEERWLEEYNRDENRYSVSRGAHRNLRRAERARVIASKIPALVESLTEKTRSWEQERKKVFLYDEVPLLAMLEEYNKQRQEKIEETQRQREMKKNYSHIIAEQENVFLSRPRTSSRLSDRSLNGGFGNASPLNRRSSLGNQLIGTNSVNFAAQGRSIKKEGRKIQSPKLPVRPNFDSHLRNETASVVSTFSGPRSP